MLLSHQYGKSGQDQTQSRFLIKNHSRWNLDGFRTRSLSVCLWSLSWTTFVFMCKLKTGFFCHAVICQMLMLILGTRLATDDWSLIQLLCHFGRKWGRFLGSYYWLQHSVRRAATSNLGVFHWFSSDPECRATRYPSLLMLHTWCRNESRWTSHSCYLSFYLPNTHTLLGTIFLPVDYNRNTSLLGVHNVYYTCWVGMSPRLLRWYY